MEESAPELTEEVSLLPILGKGGDEMAGGEILVGDKDIGARDKPVPLVVEVMAPETWLPFPLPVPLLET